MTDGNGWPWNESGTDAPDEAQALNQAFARCFAGPDGRIALNHLRHVFLDRRLSPETTDAQLRHVEGARCAIAYVLTLVARGRGTGTTFSQVDHDEERL